MNEEAKVTEENKDKTLPKNPILKKILPDGSQAEITFIDGLDYRLQHPGNRKADEWRGVSLTEKISNGDLMDNFFQYCVIPMGSHSKPNFDSLHPYAAEVWSKMAHRFLGGKLDR